MATDPVCGMSVDERTAELTLVRENRTHYFCSSSCLAEFADPRRHRRKLLRRLEVAWPASLAVLGLVYLVNSPSAGWIELGLALVVQAYAGTPFYRGTWNALRSRVANMDVLIAVGTSVAFGYSAIALLVPGRFPPVYYFDASCLIITLILTGNLLEQLARGRASSALSKLPELLPTRVRIVRDGAERTAPIEEVVVGDRLRIAPGERIPSDGVVVSGASEADESLVTGESLPVPKRPGDAIIGGSLNLEGALEIRATRVGPDSFLAQVATLLGEAELARVPLKRLADRIAERFVPLVLGIAFVAALLWAFAGASLPVVLLVFVSVSITACPCAFGIATPAAILVGTGRAAERGVLFRGSDALERAARVDVVVTDKTGTITRGHPEVVEITAGDGRSAGEVLELAFALESGSTHPLAKAVQKWAQERGSRLRPAEELRAEPGLGLTGVVEGRAVSVRRLEIDPAPAAPSNPFSAALRRVRENGWTASWVSVGGDPVGLIAFSDDADPSVPSAIRRLRADGIGIVMATGDLREAADRTARAVGIPTVQARLSPADKVALVRRLQSEGHRVAFVGDGINDAPSLSAADLGIAVGTGTEIAREAGQVLLVRPGFEGVAEALSIGRRTVAKVRQNLLWAIGYNLVLLPIAAGALVPVLGFAIYQVLPITGALAMGLSSTLVVLNSLTLRGGGPKATDGFPRLGRPIPS